MAFDCHKYWLVFQNIFPELSPCKQFHYKLFDLKKSDIVEEVAVLCWKKILNQQGQYLEFFFRKVALFSD